MVVDTGPVVSALVDAGVAVAAVGLAVLLVAMVVSIFRNLKLVLGVSSSPVSDGSLGREETVEEWADRMRRDDPSFYESMTARDLRE